MLFSCLRPMIAPFDKPVRRSNRFISVLWAIACLMVALGAAACDKIALVAPSNSSITLFSNLTTINLGGSAQITATVIEGGGTPVHDGTEVTFTTTIGTVDPVTLQTDDGKATVTCGLDRSPARRSSARSRAARNRGRSKSSLAPRRSRAWCSPRIRRTSPRPAAAS